METQKVNSRTLNSLQRRAVKRVLRHYRNAVSYNGVTSVRLALRKFPNSPLVFVNVETRRSDCHEFSERQLLCRRTAHLCVGPRGALKVYDAQNGLTDEKQHIAYMLNGKVA